MPTSAQRSFSKSYLLLAAIFCLMAFGVGAQELAKPPFLLKFVDSATRRPLPLVEIEMFNALRLCSDNLGHIAVNEPDLIGKTVRMVIRGHGYRFPNIDILGERAISVKIEPGSLVEVELNRTVAAERLYRITGSGRFRDSILAHKTAIKEHYELPGKVIGLDSAIPVWWQNRLFCFWGDTLATDRINLRGSGGRIITSIADVPEKSLPVSFFTDNNGCAKPMIKSDDQGFFWIETVLPLLTETGREVLAARYVKHVTLEKAVETGFAIFRPGLEEFSIVKRLESPRHHKSAHAVAVNDHGKPAFCIQPWEKTDTSLKNFINPRSYWHYTCLSPARPGESEQTIVIDGQKLKVDRSVDAQPRFAWVKGGVPFSPAVQRLLLNTGLLKPSERWLELTEIGTGKKMPDFSGSICWNSFRKRWIMIAQGLTGEIWFSEADTFTGPWVFARRIVEHDGYNFYNPVQHSWFDTDGGRTIYFEGTYTSFFTRENYKTPRADYNQVMYKLDLANPDLLLPVPVYRVKRSSGGWRLLTGDKIAAGNLWNQVQKVEFLAFASNPHNSPHLQPVFDHADEDATQPDLRLERDDSNPVFFSICSNENACTEMQFASELTAVPSKIGTIFKNTSNCLTLTPDIKPR